MHAWRGLNCVESGMLPGLSPDYGPGCMGESCQSVGILASWHRQIRAPIRRQRGCQPVRKNDVQWNEKKQG